MLTLQGVVYTHPNRDVLFSGLNLVINKHDKIALIGNNGTGKSTLLQLLAGNLHPSQGVVKTDSRPYYVPQLTGPFNDSTVAEALQIAGKLTALTAILHGDVTETNLALLDDDWGIEERCQEAFAHWGLDGLHPDRRMGTLSGGQKTRVFLAGILIHRPEIVLLDEPSNHLDASSRSLLYAYITSTNATLVVVSHDRTLLNFLGTIYELGRQGIRIYGGNYDFYAAQKKIETDALNQDLVSKEKALRKAKEVARESLERQQKLDSRGKKKQEKAGLPTISMNTLRNNAEKSTSRMKGIHAEKTEGLSQELSELRRAMPDIGRMKMGLRHSSLHAGKILVTAKGVNVGFGDRLLWKGGLDVQLSSGERVSVTGRNGSGKTTFLKLILGELQPQSGTLYRADVNTIYIDQDYSLINDGLTVYEQAQQFNSGALQAHEIGVRLNRFLFVKSGWDKPCRGLSGGEKMRLMLCCLTISDRDPDLIVLDEPTNNLDIQHMEILTAAIHAYRGTLVVVSHDVCFLKGVDVGREIVLANVEC